MQNELRPGDKVYINAGDYPSIVVNNKLSGTIMVISSDNFFNQSIVRIDSISNGDISLKISNEYLNINT